MKLNKLELNRKLHQELIAVDNLIAKYGIAEDDALTRQYIDQRRQLFAEYEQTLIGIVPEGTEDNTSKLVFYRVDPELDEFINLWCAQIRSLEFRPIYLSDSEYCQRFLDCYLPKSWNWQTDFVMLINPFDEKILNELANRGQKNVIIFRTKTATLFSESLRNKFNEFWEISTLEELEQGLWHYPLKVSNICHFDCLGHSEADINSEKINKIVKESIYVRQINLNTIGKHSGKWARNTIKNIPNILEHKNIENVSLTGSKTGVIVSPGPSLEKNIKVLKEHANKVFIICPIRAVPILRANGLEPDFVFQLDAIGGKFLENSKSIIDTPVKNLVLDATVDPGFFDFPAEKKYWYFSESKILGLDTCIGSGKLGLEAVSVSIACLKFAYHFGLTNLILVGQDLAFAANKRYSNGGDLNFMPTVDLAPEILVDGYYGGKVGTSADYDYFIDRFAELGLFMSETGCKVYNCTEGGAYIENFEHLPLAQVLACIGGRENRGVYENPSQTPSIEGVIKFCKNAKKQILSVESYGRRTLEIESKCELSVDDVRSRDKYLRKMVAKSDESKILWWAFQDILMNTQQLTYRKENVTDLSSFLDEIIEITSSIIKCITATEVTLLARMNANKK